MSEPNGSETSESVPDDDAVRQHAQDPAEGPDGDSASAEDVPRVHSEDPAEG